MGGQHAPLGLGDLFFSPDDPLHPDADDDDEFDKTTRIERISERPSRLTSRSSDRSVGTRDLIGRPGHAASTASSSVGWHSTRIVNRT